MIKEGKFGPAGAIVLLAVSNVAGYSPYPRSLVERRTCRLITIGGFALPWPGLISCRCPEENPDNTIIEITEDGPALGITFNLITIAFFISVSFLLSAIPKPDHLALPKRRSA